MNKPQIQTQLEEAATHAEQARLAYINALSVRKHALAALAEARKGWKRANINLARVHGAVMEAEGEALGEEQGDEPSCSS